MRAFICCLLLFCITACTNKDSIPKDVIARDTMQNILWDMVKADQFSTQYLLKDSARLNVKKETMKLYAQVFRIHHISGDQFRKSFQYYLSRPDITKIMFDSLYAQANRSRADIYKQKDLNKKPAVNKAPAKALLR